MRIVLAYDVVRDRRRIKLYKRLRGRLLPVQRSVFEGDVSSRGLSELDALIHEVVDLGTDSVRVYVLCEACASRLRLYGVSVPVDDADAPREF